MAKVRQASSSFKGEGSSETRHSGKPSDEGRVQQEKGRVCHGVGSFLFGTDVRNKLVDNPDNHIPTPPTHTHIGMDLGEPGSSRRSDIG